MALNKQKIETALKERIVDSAPMSIMTIEKNGVITFVNKYFRKFASAKQGVGSNIFHKPFFIREKLVPEYQRLFAEGKPFIKRSCKTRTPAGEIRYLKILAVPLKNEKGQVEAALSMAVDVTQTVMAKIKLRELNDNLAIEVARKTEKLTELNKKLEKSLELKTQFIADATHELRTPLAIAKLNLELFKKEIPADKKECAKDLGAIENEMNKIRDILADLSVLTGIDEEAAGKIVKGKVDLSRLVENVIKRLKTFADKKNIGITWQKNIEGLIIEGDEGRLETVLSNIIRNALKYSGENGWVKVWLEPDPIKKTVKINVEDNGIGIPKKDLPFIFDRFFRTELSRKSGEGGFGLGLSICKWIMEQHNGFIEVKSTVGKGSLFAINLPTEQSRS